MVGIDINPNFIEMANQVTKKAKLNNTRCICNEGMDFEKLKTFLGDETFHVAFLMEVLEHVGDHGIKQHRTRAHFLKNVSELLHSNGLMVISVPIMIGIPFLLQRVGLTFFNLHREPYSIPEFFLSVFLKNTKRLESSYRNGHKGFNHERFEKTLEDLKIVAKIRTFFQMMYVIKKK